MKDLKDTVDLMLSNDYKERLKAEYWQTKIRYNHLYKIVVAYEAGKLPFLTNCPLDLFKQQMSSMRQYLYCLEVRAMIEGIDLNNDLS